MIRVAHIVPALDIGGVEIGVERSLGSLRSQFDYRVFYVRRRGKLVCGQRHVLTLLTDSLTGRWRPQIVVTSLWWAHPFGFLFRFFKARWLAFFHSSGFSHTVDHILLSWAWRACDARLVDSQATFRFMASGVSLLAHVVPYAFSPPTVGLAPLARREIDFIWVGRANAVKRLDLLVPLVLALQAHIARARLTVIIAGAAPIELLMQLRSGPWDVDIMHDVPHAVVMEAMSRSRFYVLTSDYEGMSMSTVEAVACGCVPIVRPVGEIPNYLDDKSAIFLRGPGLEAMQDVVAMVLRLRKSQPEADAIAAQARARVMRLPNYVDAIAAALRRAVS